MHTEALRVALLIQASSVQFQGCNSLSCSLLDDVLTGLDFPLQSCHALPPRALMHGQLAVEEELHAAPLSCTR